LTHKPALPILASSESEFYQKNFSNFSNFSIAHLLHYQELS
jgi:hypothetical protein